MELIETLKDQHKEMRSLADSMRDTSKTSSQRMSILAELKKLLAEHRNLEDTQLYPLLIENAQNNSALKKKLDAFASDWQEVSAFSKEYLQKYSQNISDDAFFKDTGKFFANLKSRTMKEEIGLFAEYEKLKKSSH